MVVIEYITYFIWGLIIGAITVYLQPRLDSWTIVQEFSVASISATVGCFILRKSRNKTGKHRLFYHSVGIVPLAVGVAILILPLIKWITERAVFEP